MESRASPVHESQRCVQTSATLEQSERQSSQRQLSSLRDHRDASDGDDSNGNDYARLRNGRRGI
jgi:hypothetical protein